MGLGSVLGNIGSTITGRRPSVMTPPFLMSPQQQPPLTNPPNLEDDQPPLPPQDPQGPPVYDPNTEDAPPRPGGIGSTMGNAGPMSAPAAPSPAPPPAAAPRLVAESRPLPTPPPPPNTPGGQHIGLGRKIAGALVEGASMMMPPLVPLGHTIGQKLSQGGYPAQRAQYEQEMANREEQAKLEASQEGTAGLKEQRLATGEYRRAQAADLPVKEKERQSAIQAGADAKAAQQKTAQYNVKIKGREDSVIPILPGENAPSGWQVIDHPDGGKVAMPPSLTTIPEQLVPYFPGRKAGEVIGMGEYEKANKIYRETLSKRELQDNKPDKDPANEVGLALAAARGDKTAAAALKSIQAGKQTSAIQLTPEAVQFWAQSAAQGVPLPAMGMGAAGAKAREQIINAAPGAAGGHSLTENKTSLHANAGSLDSMQKMRDAVGAFEKTALANLDLFTKQAKAVVDSGSPLVNTPLRQINRQLLGSKEGAAYDAARQVALTEIAKVVNNPSLAGQLSDSARHEVTGLIPENATLGQIYHVVQILKQDMANRKKYLDEGLGEIKGRISGGRGGGGTQPQADPLGIR